MQLSEPEKSNDSHIFDNSLKKLSILESEVTSHSRTICDLHFLQVEALFFL